MKLDNDLAAYIKKKLINRAALRAESPSKFTEAGLRLVSPAALTRAFCRGIRGARA